MKEASRIEAMIEVLGEILNDTHPTDNILDKYFKAHRYIGSKDRRFINDNIWKIIRQRMHIFHILGKENFLPRLIVAYYFQNSDLDLLFNGEEYAPEPLSINEKNILKNLKPITKDNDEIIYECPQWLSDKFEDKNLLLALNTKAPLDVRVNFTTREQALTHLKKEGLFFSKTPLSPYGLRTDDRINLNNCATYLDGMIEVMDEGSQLLALLIQAKKHHKIIDYCAGAGGKSLAIGAMLNNEGIIYAHDINQERLNRIKKRAERLDITNIKIIQSVSDKDYDRFIIDAPCSGSGTWRRSPDAKYRLTETKLENIIKTQQELLDFGAKHTKLNGLLIYMTCSLFPEENDKQIENFLKTHTNFSPINHHELWTSVLESEYYPFKTDKYLQFSPINTKTDGFFFVALRKTSLSM